MLAFQWQNATSWSDPLLGGGAERLGVLHGARRHLAQLGDERIGAERGRQELWEPGGEVGVAVDLGADLVG